MKQYTPVLKWKQGEQMALKELSQQNLNAIVPIIEIIAKPKFTPNDSDEETDIEKEYQNYLKKYANHLQKSASNLSKLLSKSNFFLDILSILDDPIDLSFENSQQLTPAYFILNYCSSNLNTNCIPIINSSIALSEYKPLIPLLNTFDSICIRIDAKNIENICAYINEVISTICENGQSLYLVLDYKYIDANNKNLAIKLARLNLMDLEPIIPSFKEIIYIGTAIPQSLTNIKADTIESIPRTEFIIWRELISNYIPSLIFGDYCISNPEAFDDINPIFLKPSANIRYTTQDYYLILKGQLIKKYGFEQFKELCSNLCKRPEYMGPTFSKGDQFIYDCSQGGASGNLTTWRKVGTEHHIKLVLNQLANLS